MINHSYFIYKEIRQSSKNLNYPPASSVKSSRQSSVLRTPARRESCSSFPGRFSRRWPSCETAAAHSPWSSWWGEGAGPACGQWQCPKAWWSGGGRENVIQSQRRTCRQTFHLQMLWFWQRKTSIFKSDAVMGTRWIFNPKETHVSKSPNVYNSNWQGGKKHRWGDKELWLP